MESDVELFFTKKLKSKGAICWKMVSPGTSGVPDRIVIYHGSVYFVELKDTGRHPRKLQRYVHAKLNDQGFPVYVIDTKEGADMFIDQVISKGLPSLSTFSASADRGVIRDGSDNV